MPRDLNRAIERIEEATYGKPSPRSPASNKAETRSDKQAIRSWHVSAGKPQAASAKGTPTDKDVLTARSIQLKVPLDPEEVLRLSAPSGQPRVRFSVVHDGSVMSADVAAKAVRKAQAAIAQAAPRTFSSCCKASSAAMKSKSAAWLSKPRRRLAALRRRRSAVSIPASGNRKYGETM